MPFSYRGQAIKVVVTSPLGQYLVVVESYARGLAVDAGVLRAMWSENELAGVERGASVTVDALVVEASARSRRTVAEQLGNEVATSAAILETLRRNASFFEGTDSFWRVEHALWSSFTRDAVVEKICSVIMNCLPKHLEKKTLEEVLASFSVAERSKVIVFAARS